ncbi:Eco57I restriction-modification methylase domain-containing protein [uncultured Bacteroides sp.]|uniref:type IIG restriction enzyme/methyltransferase n=1 Tax=uncultured Bacteroides sp. TaxID=162156 RepID=UPI002637958D|nr:Eco57I restriction-modification methylase domain-containing protein [uncultured Bacteroides sp.]
MSELTIAKSLNKAYRQVSIDKQSFDTFKQQLGMLYKQIATIDTEEKLKGDLMDFLKLTFYGQNFKVSPNGRIDCAIHLGNSIDTPVGVIFEVKMPTNASEMITKDNLNRKALQELLLYYLRERIEKKNIQLKQLVVTNIYEYFIFDAQEFERVFYSNKKLIKQFTEFNDGTLTSDKTNFFYKEIAAEVIESVKDNLSYTWFDIRKYKTFLNNGTDKRIIELYKIFSPEHLLKKRFQNDSNSLNTKFYSELLYIIGLEEVEEKDSHKRIITRQKASNRNAASILENTITILDSEDLLDNIQNRSSFGKDRKEQLFNVALTLTIGWINRILFLKLLEAQLVKYHKGDKSYAFLSSQFIPDYDELNKLFFQVLAKRYEDRTEVINEKFGKIPYLNSSLFEVSPLERNTIRISNLGNGELPLYNNTILKDGKKPRYKQLPTLLYLLEFLDAYDFASEGSEEVQETSKTLISASVLGLIFEKINGHKDGSVFTPGAVTMYMSRKAIQATILRKFNEETGWNCSDYETLKDKDITDFKKANAIVDSIRICDPAVGSGHFLVSVLNEIIRTKYDLGILLDCNGKRIKKQDWNIEIVNDELIVSDADGEPFVYIPGNDESQRIQEALFNEKRRIIENCLFGVDLNPNAVNICRLRLWIELLKNAYYTKDSEYTYLETLPNIDINIKVGNSLIHRFDFKQDISEILKKANVSINQYKDAVNRYKNAHSKNEKRELEEMISTIKSTLRTYISMDDPKISRKIHLERELNDLLTPKLFEISKKEKAQQEKRAKELKAKIGKLNDEIEEIRNNKMFIGAFEWRIEFPEILDDAGHFIGFDCVIGNPPYIQLQKMGTNADALQKMSYKTYERSGDIYCLFYEIGMALLKPNAMLSFITSNKWMRAGYGKTLREYISTKFDPIQLIDFANNKIFDSATVLVNILSIIKRENQGETIACSIEDNFDITKLSDYVETHTVCCAFMPAESWAILSNVEKSIKAKVEAIGTPLKDWDIQINYGIKTGCNDAFIIDSEKRKEILANCIDDDERVRTAELIRPILRGRDICRYGYKWADLWLINTHNGIKGRKERILIENYPSIKQHLDNYWNQIESRADRGDTPYNLRNCVYVDEFSKPKIVWGNLNVCGSYAIASEDMFINAPACMIVPGNNYLLSVLNSKIADFYIRTLGVVRNGGFFEYKPMFVEQIPIPQITEETRMQIDTILASSLSREDKDAKIDEILVKIYGLSEDEIIFLHNQ